MKLWKFLTTDIRELNWKQAEDVTKTGTEAAKAVFDLGKALQEQGTKADDLKLFVGKISSLLDVLNSPLGQVVKEAVPFASIAIGMIKVIAEATKREPTLEECIVLVSQTAYLESLRSLLKPYTEKLEQTGQKGASGELARQLKELGDKNFIPQDARQALLDFPASQLAQAFKTVLIPRLREAEFSEAEAKTLADRVSWNTPRYVHQALAAGVDILKPLAEIYRNGGQQVLGKYQSLEDYLDSKIRPLPDQVIFQEETTGSTDLQVTYRELYVPLNGQPLDCDGKKLKAAAPVELATWVARILQDDRKAQLVMFIQGEAGRGKSVFCRMFANQVWRDFYPSYTPILIKLRGLKTLANRLQDTLESSEELQNCDFVTSDPGWLTDANLRFLFLLDGFDELLLEGRPTGGLKEFLNQVEQFQLNSKHRFVITGRPLALLQVERVIFQNRCLERIELQPMDVHATETWVSQWAKKAGEEETEAFLDFLKACPQDIQTLSREPLLMYMLARMHRESQLKVAMFAGAEAKDGRVRIYDAAIAWVLEKQRQTENSRLTGLEPDDLRQFLTEAATCVVQSGNEIAPVAMLEKRLKSSQNPAAKLLEQSRQETRLEDSKALNNLLTSFYLKPAEKGGSIEFVHKSFGEFLFAERLLEALEDWSRIEARRGRGQFVAKDADMHPELYNLLGYGGLTPEIVRYLTPRLIEKLPDESLLPLFQRLNDFYDRWCEGEFIDAEQPTLPQLTMRLLKEQVPAIGQRQVDVYTGLNTMILLLELHCHAQKRTELKDKMFFYPSGQSPEGSDKRTDRLLKVIRYSDAIAPSTFTAIVGPFLSRANLDRANLDRANLDRASLDRANLISANLDSANLDSANLDRANLDRANLDRANLYSATLSSATLDRATLDRATLDSATLTRATLTRATLTRATLTRANLTRANLDSANLDSASLDSANLDSATLISANLSGANLSSANLYSAYLYNANLSSANLSSANLSSATLSSANLDRANLDRANLDRAYLIGAQFWDADLKGDRLVQAKDAAKRKIQAAKSWENAKYEPEIRIWLGLPPVQP